MKKCTLFGKVILAAILFSWLCPGFADAQITSNPDPAAAGAAVAKDPGDQPISNTERFAWFAKSTVGPKSLATGVVSAAWGTARNKPKEYGPHWEGFGKRYGMRLTGVATGNAIEAALGGVWDEDPRYFHSTDNRPLPRLRHAAAMVFIARRPGGNQAPAFARYTGIVGGNFISNTWRVSSQNTVSAALTRSALGFVGKLASNLFGEFWQDIRHNLRKRP